ncbi:MAG: OmpA family protein [Bacteroidales bacterium]|nr:OmpA family protein [Bacteroidales bacterium]
MKKLFLSAIAFMAVATSVAQEMALQQSEFFDNWSITLKGGGATPLANHAFWGDMRGVAGLEIRKQISPVFGMGVEGEWSVNTSSWLGYSNKNAFDHQLVGLFGTVNFNNLFAGYAGAPRVFEIEAQAGAGWLHGYNNSERVGGDYNDWYTKAGLNLNFNLGESKAWTISLKPSVVWNMAVPSSHLTYSSYNVNHASLELLAGVTYHFKNSNGLHHFGLVKAYNQTEVDALNARVNELRSELMLAGAALEDVVAKNKQLENDLAECRNRKPEVISVVKVDNQLSTVRYVNFTIGKSTISADQMPNVAAVASYLKNHPKSKVVIKGYASKDGPEDVNIRLANQRAESVKNTLIKKYGIASDRIEASGQGIGEMFDEESWNRVAICTVDE